MKSENRYGRSVCRRLYVLLLGLFLILASFHLYMVKAEENEKKQFVSVFLHARSISGMKTDI